MMQDTNGVELALSVIRVPSCLDYRYALVFPLFRQIGRLIYFFIVFFREFRIESESRLVGDRAPQRIREPLIQSRKEPGTRAFGNNVFSLRGARDFSGIEQVATWLRAVRDRLFVCVRLSENLAEGKHKSLVSFLRRFSEAKGSRILL